MKKFKSLFCSWAVVFSILIFIFSLYSSYINTNVTKYGIQFLQTGALSVIALGFAAGNLLLATKIDKRLSWVLHFLSSLIGFFLGLWIMKKGDWRPSHFLMGALLFLVLYFVFCIIRFILSLLSGRKDKGEEKFESIIK